MKIIIKAHDDIEIERAILCVQSVIADGMVSGKNKDCFRHVTEFNNLTVCCDKNKSGSFTFNVYGYIL